MELLKFALAGYFLQQHYLTFILIWGNHTFVRENFLHHIIIASLFFVPHIQQRLRYGSDHRARKIT